MRNDYLIQGDVTIIYLQTANGKRLEAIIDTADLPRAMELKYRWYANWCDKVENYYVVGRHEHMRAQSLHRWVTRAKKGFVVDHINHNTLDNRRSCNLREVTVAQNRQNRKGPRRGSSSKYLGVHWDKRDKVWTATAVINGKRVFKRNYKCEEEAGRAAAEARRKYHAYSKEAMIVNGDPGTALGRRGTRK